MKNYLFLLLFLSAIQIIGMQNPLSAHAAPLTTIEVLQNANAGKHATIVIQTSAQCGSCKDRIEKALKNTQGVKKATLDLGTKKVSVKYNTTKTNPDEIRKAISGIGYDADQVPAKPAAYNALPACCKKGGH